VLLESPRVAAARARVYRRQESGKPRERWLRIVALVATLLLHFTFLVGVVLGPAYVPEDLPDHPDSALKVRLIDTTPEPPPPPPIRGTPPKERGPLHRGRSASAIHGSRVAVASAKTTPADAPRPVPSAQAPVITAVAPPSAAKPQPTAAPIPPVSLPTPAPTPELQPVPLTGEPPTITLDTPPTLKPVPPRFQPEPLRKLQAEGNRPIPPPPSLALPALPAQMPPPINPPTIALDASVPKTSAPASAVAARPSVAAAPPVPELQPVPLPAQPSPTVNLQTQIRPPTPVVATERPQIQAPSIQIAQAQLEAVPLAPPSPRTLEKPQLPAPAAPAITPAAPRVEVNLARPQLSPLPVAAAKTTPAAAEAQSKTPAAAAEKALDHAAETSPTADSRERDVSTAPNATPQGRDDATPGSPQGAERAPQIFGKDGSINLPAPGQGSRNGVAGISGSGQGEQRGLPGGYIQLKPHGDTEIMRHTAPNIGYKPTRFEQDWAPEGESSIDTALRHAVEKTTIKHTFHLPRGVRIECEVIPLFPMAMFGCGNPDPPAKPLDDKVYQRLTLGPANPLVPPVPASTTPAPAAPIKLDNSVQCANARVSGGPMPKSCTTAAPPPIRPASPSPGSWVPASDQFH
jgi:hypothetical protein